MKNNDQQRLVLNLIILVIAAFILIFMLLGKFLSSSDPTSFIHTDHSKQFAEIKSGDALVILQEQKNA